ncbi:hypothetical protein RND71_006555 [Anisodus tanguticus]|uniref:Uncharacterized protein n=1 Tax=Anisodus tanguticus TaxID=243964 RepID=A0AAE1VMH0_9SOLA|nr:hypothetical protein RND71_006555 [Anisodus tanguticus]
MVVCRLRKNSEFHLNDTPINQRNQLAATDTATALSGAGQLGLVELVNIGDCCSKEDNSSFLSHSVEQIDSGSESDQPTKEFSQHYSTGHFKDCDGEEDWFADIMKDDIIKLDDSSLNARPISMVHSMPDSSEISNHEAQAAMSSVVPFQGTANRRLRLVREIVVQCQVEGSKPYKATKKNKVGVGTTSSARWLRNMFSVRRMRQHKLERRQYKLSPYNLCISSTLILLKHEATFTAPSARFSNKTILRMSCNVKYDSNFHCVRKMR